MKRSAWPLLTLFSASVWGILGYGASRSGLVFYIETNPIAASFTVASVIFLTLLISGVFTAP